MGALGARTLVGECSARSGVPSIQEAEPLLTFPDIPAPAIFQVQ